MLKVTVVLLIIIFMTLSSTPSYAGDDDALFSAHFYNDVVLGTVAGLIIGLAVGQGSILTFRMTSLGLYGGIILGLTTGGPSRYEDRQNPSSEFSPKTPTYVFSFHY